MPLELSDNLPIKTYHGNCQCGDVRYTVNFSSLEDGAPVTSCNCSICTRNGYLLIYPKKEDVTFTRGKDKLKVYQFANKVVDHQFCPNCGTSIGGYAEQYDMMAVNVRTFQDIDVSKLTLNVLTHPKDTPPLYKLDP